MEKFLGIKDLPLPLWFFKWKRPDTLSSKTWNNWFQLSTSNDLEDLTVNTGQHGFRTVGFTKEFNRIIGLFRLEKTSNITEFSL